MFQERVGSVVTYVDRDGQEHQALVIFEWGSCLNLVYVHKPFEANPSGGYQGADSMGFERKVETSVPRYESDMGSFYYKE